MGHLISIITVTYNASSTVETTLRSIAKQTWTDYEHIIVDGASTDDTLQKVNSITTNNQRVISEPDNGLYDAMNKGIDMAKGEYLLFLNAGDAFHSPDTLSHIASAIISNNRPGIVYGQTDIVDSNGRFITERHLRAPEHLSYESFAEGMVVCHQAFVALARIVEPFDLKYKFSADYEWCIRCLQHSRKNVYVDETLIDYLRDGMSTANRRKSLFERFKIMCYYYGTIPTIRRHMHFAQRFLKHRAKERDSIKNIEIQNTKS